MARKVLLADDSGAVRKAVEATLDPKEFEFFAVSDGDEAIREAKRTHPDIILLDSDLPQGDGYEICRRVKADPELTGVPVILLTAEGEASEENKAEEVGADGRLTKPFQGKELMGMMFALVDMSVESTVKIDTADMEVLDFGEEGEASEEEFELDELELEEADVLELEEKADLSESVVEKKEPEGLEFEEDLSFEEADVLELEVGGDLSGGVAEKKEPEGLEFEEDLNFEEADVLELEVGGDVSGSVAEKKEPEGLEFEEELSFEEDADLDFEISDEAPLPTSGISTEEIDEISFEEEISDLDLGDLELEGAEEVLPLEDDLGLGDEDVSVEELSATGEVDLDLDLDEGIEVGGEDRTTELDLLGDLAEEKTISLDGREAEVEDTSGAKAKGIVDTEELEDIPLEEMPDEVDLGDEAGLDVADAEGELLATSIELSSEDELPFMETQEEAPAPEAEQQLEEEAVFEEEELALDETSIELEALDEFTAEAEDEILDTDLQELAGAEEEIPLTDEAIETAEPSATAIEFTEPLEALEETRIEADASDIIVEEDVAQPPFEGATAEGLEQPTDEGLEVLEEIPLVEGLTAGAVDEATPEEFAGAEFEEIPLDSIPMMKESMRFELTELDFGFVDPLSEEGIRKEIAQDLQEMVESILSDIAPPIIERMTREIALERADKIVTEEIQRLKSHPEGQ